MATDKSEPRVGLILGVAVISIAALVAVRGALASYFDHVARAEEHRKFGELKPEALIDLRSDERARLVSGPLPIDKAMQQIAARGRKDSSPDIMPSASRDLAPLQGWSKMPGEVPREMMVGDAAPAVAAPSIIDGGGATTAMGDAAAPNGSKPEHARPSGIDRTPKSPAKNQ